MSEPQCIFCKIVSGELPASIVAQDERTVAFMDINPATAGHTLVIPRVHARDIHAIDADDLGACALMAQRIAGRAIERLDAAGVNLLNAAGSAAWQTVFHFHIHVIPRYDNDPLRLPWVPGPGEPGAIERAAAALRDR